MNAGHEVLLLPELRHPEGVDDVLRRHPQHHRAIHREPQDVGLLVLVAGIGEAPEELLRRDFDAQRIGAAASSFVSTIALTIAMPVTSTAGTAVQMISRPVCPCTVGRPSRRPASRGT